MAIDILMPALSPTMELGTLAKWFVKKGDMVKPGDLLAEIETDKAIMEFEAVEEGKILQLLVEEGQKDIPVNSIIAKIQSEGSNNTDSDKIIEIEGLRIPHPEAHRRLFVVKPMAEIAESFNHPVLNEQMSSILQRL